MIEQNNPNSVAGESRAADSNWEREVIEKLALAAIVEQRRTRRWGIFFKSLLYLYIFAVSLAAFFPFADKPMSKGDKHTAVVYISGIIFDGTKADAESVIDGLQAAVEDENTRGVIVQINSPGGSPVQADYIFKEIRRLKREKPELPIHAVVTDLCASAGYYIAAAADKIFVNPSSLIGSIGVIMNGFGFVSTMERLGVERRLLTAGEHKAFLDPFSPVDESEKGHLQVMLNQVHAQFIKVVKEGRGDRLKNDADLFSGLIWTGEQSIELGLADGEGDIHSVARDVIGAENIVDFTPEESVFDRLTHRFGSVLGQVFSEIARPRLGY
ncbi:MAG: S49 family peptidase [Methylococcaceae bacterium]|nr:S49 family peptidase [Methylococcaceae bacterium]MCI0733614.1 S49 family peptidase [Methylococcaceae bacterium]